MGYMGIPFWTPHEPGKLFKRFTFEEEIKVDNNNELIVELNDYTNFTGFKWVFTQAGTQTQTTQPHTNYLANTSFFTIIVEPGVDIAQDDIIWLRSSDFPSGAYFIVAEPPNNNVVYTPKAIQMSQRITLRSLLHEV